MAEQEAGRGERRSKLYNAVRMMEALTRDARRHGEIPRLNLRLHEVRALLEKIQDEGGISGSVESMTDDVLLNELERRLAATPTDEAPEGTVHATISCENPECESRGQEPHKLHDGDPLDYCQVCCEETLTLRLHAPGGERCRLK